MNSHDINYFIKKIRNVEKLNKTNAVYKQYKSDFENYLFYNLNANSEIINKLSSKSSCIPHLLHCIYNKQKSKLIKVIDKLNNSLLNNQYSIQTIVNYSVNILSNFSTKSAFIFSLKDKDLLKETFFSKILNKDFSKYTKLEVNNSNLLNNIFFKFFEKEIYLDIFIKTIKFEKYDLHNSNNLFLQDKDIFHKNLLLILIELFTKKYSFNIRNLEQNIIPLKIYFFIYDLIKYTYTELIHESKLITNNNTLLTLLVNERINNIKYIIEDSLLLEYNKNFFETSLLWLIKIDKLDKLNKIDKLNKLNKIDNPDKLNKIDNPDNLSKIDNLDEKYEECLKTIYLYFDFNIDKIVITKNIYILISNIFDYKLTKNYNLIIDFYYLTNKLLSKEERKKFAKHYFYISKVINKLLKNFSLIYEKIRNENYVVFEVIYEMCFIFNQTLLYFGNYRRLFENEYDKNIYYFKKFCCVFLENIIFNIDKLIDGVKKKMDYDIKYYQHSIKVLFITLKYLCLHYKKIIFCDELKQLFSEVIEYFLNKTKNIAVNNIEFDLISIYCNIKDIVIEINNINFFKNVDFSDLKLKLLELNKITINQLVFFNNHDKKIIEIYDDKYCDPITNTLIGTPIMVPENVIVDKNMITRYLLTHNENPFNRLELNINILNEYNNRPDVLIKINEYKKELLDYKKQNDFLDI
jgi:hypothetical protein